jgi:lysophospholipase L1-like esterase
VSFADPVAAGGLAPISVACTPVSGTAFALGATHVTCNGTDSATPARTAACGFTVTLVPYVPPVPVISVTKFLAVGDSITAGENGIDEFDLDDPRYVQDGPCVAMGTPSPQFLDYVNSYPSLLGGMLSKRYTSQTLTMINCGQRGEMTAGGLRRLRDELPLYKPDVLLLLEGVNNLPSTAVPSGTGDVIGDLRTDILLAKAAGAKVLLSTMTPIASQGERVDLVQRANVAPMNVRIRALAAEQGVPLVDSEALFLSRTDYERSLLDTDGLHCTPEGYRVIAQGFFDKIQPAFEVPSSSPSRQKVQVSAPAQRQPVGIRKMQ